MHEILRIVAEDTARFDEFAEAWPNLTMREQIALVEYAKEHAASA
jgi:hypothetical protein